MVKAIEYFPNGTVKRVEKRDEPNYNSFPAVTTTTLKVKPQP